VPCWNNLPDYWYDYTYTLSTWNLFEQYRPYRDLHAVHIWNVFQYFWSYSMHKLPSRNLWGFHGPYIGRLLWALLHWIYMW